MSTKSRWTMPNTCALCRSTMPPSKLKLCRKCFGEACLERRLCPQTRAPQPCSCRPWRSSLLPASIVTIILKFDSGEYDDREYDKQNLSPQEWVDSMSKVLQQMDDRSCELAYVLVGDAEVARPFLNDRNTLVPCVRHPKARQTKTMRKKTNVN